MCKQFCLVVALFILGADHSLFLGQQPPSKPLRETQDILNNSKVPSAAGLSISLLEGISTKPTLANLTGTWGYIFDGQFRRSFEIKSDGTAIASGYFAGNGQGKATIQGEQVEIVVNATWGPLSGLPYLKWVLRYEDGKLVGQSWFRTTDNKDWSGTGNNNKLEKQSGKQI